MNCNPDFVQVLLRPIIFVRNSESFLFKLQSCYAMNLQKESAGSGHVALAGPGENTVRTQ